ncbi:hypothetical protein VNO78_24307 [Psophocarpus tetragonolobus]|uniref:Uncharacterized protein n=1 Tax=Psophocarpus tetragonolobus TaxID=3891 RepID=A0AAN9S4B7_PSOTE
MDEISLVCDRSKLEILIAYMDEDIIYSENVLNSFFKNMIRLQVLYLSRKTWTSRHWKGNISLSLSHSVKSLINIRSLIVEGFDLGDISILGYLEGLETLDLIECSMNELPCEIEKLKKLKLLLLKKCYIERNNPFKVIENCSSLEELHFICNMMSTIRQQNVNLFKFKRFRIELFQVRHRSLMNSLCLENGDEIFPEATLKHLAQAAECLHIREGGWRNLIPTIVLPKDEGTLNVVNLNLKSMPQLECLVDNKHIDSRMKDVFSKLVEIELGEMENLRELCSGSFPVQLFQSLETLLISNCTHLQGILFKSKLSLCNLKSLILRSCPMLTSLFHLSNSQSLILLENLEICSCAELKYIFDFGGDNDKRSIGLKFLNLKFLYIGSCPKLDFILPVVAAQDVPKLECIKIDNCAELKYIFYPYQCEHDEQDLPQELKDTIFAMLKEVVLQDLPKFVDIFPKCDKSMCSSKERPCSKEESKTIPESFPIKCNVFAWCLKYRPKLRNTRTSLNSCDHLQDYSLPLVHDSQVNDMIGREMIAWLVNVDFKIFGLEECNNLKCVFPVFTSIILPKLEILIVGKASMLEEVFKCGSDKKVEIPNLKVAAFVELPSLCKDIDDFHAVKDRLVLNCPKLSLTSTLTPERMEEIIDGIEGTDQASVCTRETLNYVCENYVERSQNQDSSEKLMEEFPIENVWSEWPTSEGKDKGEKAINSTSDVNIEHAITKDVANGDFRDSFNSSITPSETSSPGFEEINLPIKELLQGSLHNHYEDDHDISNENLSANATEEFLVETKVQEISGRELISSQEGSEGQIAIPSFSMVNTELATTKNVGHGGFQETYNYGVTHSNTNASGSNVSNKHTKGALQSLLNDISESSKAQEIISQNSTAEASKDFPNETNQSIHANIADYNQPENGIQSNKFILAETKTKKTLVSEQENVENYRVLEKPLIAISPTDSELMRRLTCQIPSYAPLYKAHSSEIKRSVEEGSKSADGKTPAIPIVSESDNSLISPLVTSKSKIDQEASLC